MHTVHTIERKNLKMPKGTTLTLEERDEILKLHEQGISGREIGKKLCRSKTVVLNFLRNPSNYAKIKVETVGCIYNHIQNDLVQPLSELYTTPS